MEKNTRKSPAPRATMAGSVMNSDSSASGASSAGIQNTSASAVAPSANVTAMRRTRA